jgi:hypothetical protein
MRGIGLVKIPEASDFDDLFGGHYGCQQVALAVQYGPIKGGTEPPQFHSFAVDVAGSMN